MSYSDLTCFKQMQSNYANRTSIILISTANEYDDLQKTTCEIPLFNRYLTGYFQWVQLSLMYMRNKPYSAFGWSAVVCLFVCFL